MVDGSLKFDSGSSNYLNRTPSSEGNRKTWTWSGWFNRQNIGANDNIFKVAGSSNKATHFEIQKFMICFIISLQTRRRT